MRNIIGTMMVTMDQLVNVILLTVMLFFVFSVLGMELFGGQGANTCIDLREFGDEELGTFNNGQIGMAPLEFGILGGA